MFAPVFGCGINFYNVPDFPELLITGKEREYFTYLIKHELKKSSGNHTGCAGRVYLLLPRRVDCAV